MILRLTHGLAATLLDSQLRNLEISDIVVTRNSQCRKGIHSLSRFETRVSNMSHTLVHLEMKYDGSSIIATNNQISKKAVKATADKVINYMFHE